MSDDPDRGGQIADSRPPEEGRGGPAGGPASPPGRWPVPAAAVVAGLLAWGLGESPLVRVAPEQSNLVVMGQVTQTIATTGEAIREAERRSAIRGLAAFGALLGLAVGAASGLTSRGGRAAVIAGVAGLVAGGLAGSAATLGAVPLYEAMRTPGTQELLPALLMHVALVVPVGLAVGLAFGLGKASSPGLLIGAAITGAVGGAIGAVAFQVVGTLAFPLSGVDQLLPKTPISRLAARVSVALAVGLVLGTTATGPKASGPSDREAAG